MTYYMYDEVKARNWGKSGVYESWARVMGVDLRRPLIFVAGHGSDRLSLNAEGFGHVIFDKNVVREVSMAPFNREDYL